MRIKKKHVLKESLILEGLFIDELKNLGDFEKKVLKGLNKRYTKKEGKDFNYYSISVYDLVDELHDGWLIPFDVAYNIANIFVYHGNRLFEESPFTLKHKMIEIFKNYYNRFLPKYKNFLPDSGSSFDRWELTVGGEKYPHDVTFWDLYNGFALYLPADYPWSLSKDEMDKLGNRLIVVKCRFNFGGDEVTLKVTYTLGRSDDDKYNKEGTIIENAIIDLPEKLDQTIFNEFMNDLVMDNIKHIIEDYQFPEPLKDLSK